MQSEEIEYLADPDFLALAEVYDPHLGKRVAIEVAYGYEPRKGSHGKLILCDGVREKQLLFEASSLEIVPFRRTRPAGSLSPGAKPRRSYKPSLSAGR